MTVVTEKGVAIAELIVYMGHQPKAPKPLHYFKD